MRNGITVVGMDVHRQNIVAGVLKPGLDQISRTITIENTSKNIGKLVKSITAEGPAEFIYEAGPCGYEIQRQITSLGHRCAIIAPSHTPHRPGDRVKTDRRDAEKLARFWRMGELREIYVPNREEEAARDLLRAREDLVANELRARHRMMKFLLRQGLSWKEGKNWTLKHWEWLRKQRFEWETTQKTFEVYMRTLIETGEHMSWIEQRIEELASKPPYEQRVNYLKGLKGIKTVTAMTLLTEVHDFNRFDSPRKLMRYAGLVSSEYSSGETVRRGGILKSGNHHLKRVLVQSAWTYRFNSEGSVILRKRRENCPSEVARICRKADERLHRRFVRLVSRNKSTQKVVVAVARELLGFVWAVSRCFPAAA